MEDNRARDWRYTVARQRIEHEAGHRVYCFDPITEEFATQAEALQAAESLKDGITVLAVHGYMIEETQA